METETINVLIRWGSVIAILIIFKKDVTNAIGRLLSFTFENGENKVKAIFQGVTDGNEIDVEEVTIEEQDDSEEHWFKYFEENKYEESYDALEQYIESLEDNAKIIEYMAFKGYILSKYDRAKSKDLFENLVVRYSEYGDVYFWYARSLANYGNKSEILRIYNLGLEKSNNQKKIAYALSDYYVDLHEISEAISVLKNKLDDSLFDSEYYNKIAQLYKRNNDVEKMNDIYLNAYKIGKLDYNHISVFASELSENKKYGEAMYLYKTLLNAGYKESDMRCLLGNQYMMLGLNDLALQAYKSVNTTSKEESWVIANIGNLYSNKGLYTEAIGYLKRAVELDKDSEYSSKRLASTIENKNIEINKEKELINKSMEFFK